jgi:nucleotide-binding universal stress UspA family protein
MFSKVLVANDGSPGSRKALEAAIELANRISASLHMVMVEELPLFPASIDEIEEDKD